MRAFRWYPLVVATVLGGAVLYVAHRWPMPSDKRHLLAGAVTFGLYAGIFVQATVFVASGWSRLKSDAVSILLALTIAALAFDLLAINAAAETGTASPGTQLCKDRSAPSPDDHVVPGVLVGWDLITVITWSVILGLWTHESALRNPSWLAVVPLCKVIRELVIFGWHSRLQFGSAMIDFLGADVMLAVVWMVAASRLRKGSLLSARIRYLILLPCIYYILSGAESIFAIAAPPAECWAKSIGVTLNGITLLAAAALSFIPIRPRAR